MANEMQRRLESLVVVSVCDPRGSGYQCRVCLGEGGAVASVEHRQDCPLSEIDRLRANGAKLRRAIEAMREGFGWLRVCANGSMDSWQFSRDCGRTWSKVNFPTAADAALAGLAEIEAKNKPAN